MAIATDKLLKQLIEVNGYKKLTQEGRDLFHGIYDGEPVRTVGRGSLRAVSGEFYSPEADSTVQFESIGERAYALAALENPETLATLCQPARLRVRAHDSNGRQGYRSVTPDFVEFTKEQFFFVEVKPLVVALDLANKYPDDWQIEDEACRYLPGEVAAQALGFDFRVHIYRDTDKVAHTNALLKWRLRSAPPPAMSECKLKSVLALLHDAPRTVLEVCERVGGVTAGQLLLAIQANQIHGMLDVQVFEDGFLLFATAHQVEIHTQDLQRMNAEGKPVGPMHRRYLSASTNELKYAVRKQDAYLKRSGIRGARTSSDYSTLRRLRQAEVEGAPSLAAFVPDFKSRGGEGRPGPKELKDTFVAFVRKDYLPEVKGRPSPTRALALFETSYPEHVDKLSDETFRKLFHLAYAPERVALITQGKRGYNKIRPRTDGRRVNPRAEIVGLNAHLDGVRVDVRSSAESGNLVVWYYILVDDFTGYIFSRGICIDKSLQLGADMAFRDCVDRHNFLPATILRDAGTENNNLSEPEKVALLGVILQHRPRSDSRAGGVDEGVHSHLNAFAKTLHGSLYHDAAGRASDGNKKSRHHAKFTVCELIRKLDEWCFESWNRTVRVEDGISREQIFQESTKRYRDFLIKTTQSPVLKFATGYPSKAITFNRVRGIRFGGKAFSSDELSTLFKRNKKLESIRLDCMDPSTIWVDTGTQYIAAYSSDYADVQAMSIAERVLYTHRMLSYASNAKKNAKKKRRDLAALQAQMIQEPSERSQQADEPRAENATCVQAVSEEWPTVGSELPRFGSHS